MISKIVFFGDSITAGNKSAIEELGNGFVHYVASNLSARADLEHIQVINSGVNGNTVQDLLSRYEADVVKFYPDALVIKIGINDTYNHSISYSDDVAVTKYEEDYRRLINALRSQLPDCQILLLSPYYISDETQNPLYQLMNEYIRVVHRLGLEFELPFLNTQRIFDEAVAGKPAQSWAADQIHPGPDGHQLIAKHVYEFLSKNILS